MKDLKIEIKFHEGNTSRDIQAFKTRLLSETENFIKQNSAFKSNTNFQAKSVSEDDKHLGIEEFIIMIVDFILNNPDLIDQIKDYLIILNNLIQIYLKIKKPARKDKSKPKITVKIKDKEIDFPTSEKIIDDEINALKEDNND